MALYMEILSFCNDQSICIVNCTALCTVNNLIIVNKINPNLTMTFGDQEENHVRQEDVLNACYCVDEIRQNLCEFVILIVPFA